MKLSKILILTLCIMMASCLNSSAASQEALNAANELNAAGLFNGVGTNADGTTNYDLERAPTRNEAVTMLVRLLGKENEAKNGNWGIPFNDVADWAKPYVGYAYNNGLTSGTSKNTFDGDKTVSATQYLTFVLRALNYSSESDFKWNKAWELSDKIGLTDGRYTEANNSNFLRGDVAIISNNALKTPVNKDSLLLSQKIKGNNILYDKNNIKIIYKSYEILENGSIKINLLIENNSTESITLLSNEPTTSVNGYMINGHMVTPVGAGKKSNDYFSIAASKLKENDITDIEEIKIGFNYRLNGTNINTGELSVLPFKEYVDTECKHNYVEGKCTLCNVIDEAYVPTLKVGETWNFNDWWEFTIDSVETHELCNDLWDRMNGYTNEQVIIVKYHYKNTGFKQFNEEMYKTLGNKMGISIHKVYDGKGEDAKTYACIHEDSPSDVDNGQKCTASEAFVLANRSDKITVELMESYFSENDTAPKYARAKFELEID